jgi:hypothetical protein
MFGEGTISCGSWASLRRSGSLQAAFGPEQWVLGFLSGIGFTNGALGNDPLRGVDAEGVWAWVDNYCHAHSLETVQRAAVAFDSAHPHA